MLPIERLITCWVGYEMKGAGATYAGFYTTTPSGC
jgi:hypothetical protein